jgi:hypothetical protein
MKTGKQEDGRRRPTVWGWIVVVLKFLLSQWQIIGIGIAVLLAYLFPNVGRKGGVIKSQYVVCEGKKLIVGIPFHMVPLGSSSWCPG